MWQENGSGCVPKKLYRTARFGPGLWCGSPALRDTWLAPEDTTALQLSQLAAVSLSLTTCLTLEVGNSNSCSLFSPSSLQLHSPSETHPIWLSHPPPPFAQGSYRCPGYSSSYLLCGACACPLHHVLTSSSVTLSFSPSLGRTPTRVINPLAPPLPSSNWTRVRETQHLALHGTSAEPLSAARQSCDISLLSRTLRDATSHLLIYFISLYQLLRPLRAS